MPENLKPQQGASLPTPPKPKQSTGGIQPGTLRGSALQYASVPPQVDPDEELIAKCKAMSGSELRHFLKQGTNRQDFDQALANKGKTR